MTTTRENEIDNLLAAFQDACEVCEREGGYNHEANAKERAILRNEIRARLLAMPNKPDESQPAPADQTP